MEVERSRMASVHDPLPPSTAEETADETSPLPQADHLPTFFIIGAMKAGTTSLYHYLREHPQVFMPPFKALEFFAGGPQWERGIDWYRHWFAAAPPEAVAIGEASNVYTKYPRYRDVPARIAEHIPDARLIYVIRDPIDRIRSHYQTRVAEGTEKAPLSEAVFSNDIYVAYSRYAMQLEQYLAHFPREQLLVLLAEDLRAERASTLRRVYGFLGIDADFTPPNLDREYYKTRDRAARSPIPVWLRKGLKKYVPATRRAKELENNMLAAFRRLGGRAPAPPAPPLILSPATRERLVEVLADDVRSMRDILGQDFHGWGIA